MTWAVGIIYPEVVIQECSKTPKTGTENSKMLGTLTLGEVGAPSPVLCPCPAGQKCRVEVGAELRLGLLFQLMGSPSWQEGAILPTVLVCLCFY